jgi:hypothetical protein
MRFDFRFDYIHFSIYIRIRLGSTLDSPLRFDEPERTSIFLWGSPNFEPQA